MSTTLKSRMDPARAAGTRAALVAGADRSGRRGLLGARRWRGLPRPVVAGVVVVGVLGLGTGAAVSVTQFLQPDVLRVSCVLGSAADADVRDRRTTVADPVATCASEWPDGTAPDDLTVFMGDLGRSVQVYVAPADWDGSGYAAAPVSVEVAFDPRPARLEAALDDWVDGLESSCFSAEEAETRVVADLERLGLVGWTVRWDDNDGRETADGDNTCAWALVPEGDDREVVVRGAEAEWAFKREDLDALSEDELRTYYTEGYRASASDGTEFEQGEAAWVEESVANALTVREDLALFRSLVTDGVCRSAPEVAELVTAELDPAWNPQVEVSVDDTLPCAVLEAGMGGTWLVSVVGPQRVDAP
ncbi:hypothetical protein [Aquipuribacter sp. SD81]|uniref:hypothetical protein n=1 Tax=Aquipuribacter sp. SD81 TaxID=3127703 RepID=UPI00301655E4